VGLWMGQIIALPAEIERWLISCTHYMPENVDKVLTKKLQLSPPNLLPELSLDPFGGDVRPPGSLLYPPTMETNQRLSVPYPHPRTRPHFTHTVTRGTPRSGLN